MMTVGSNKINLCWLCNLRLIFAFRLSFKNLSFFRILKL